jgi:hypothetical protein
MSKQASKSVTFETTIRPPRAGGLCAQAWELFALGAEKQGSPVVSKQLPVLAETYGLNLTNLRIELSRFNRFMAQLAK